jgi:TusA-related sulfurtransferase
MNAWLMVSGMVLVMAATDPATCPMHAQHMAAAGEHHHDDVDHRGDAVMGFSHEKTKHTFRLLDDGGAIEVRANEAADAESIAAIRTHLQEIAKDFATGSYADPEAIHGRVPDGAATMKSLGAAVTFKYEELERGGRVHITTRDAAGIQAIHDFMKFQIDEHHTGDPLEVSRP